MMNARSEKALQGVHPDLVRVVRLAHSRMKLPLSFIVTEGIRTELRQRQLVALGASRTMRSRHITGHAVDLAATVDDLVRWDWPLYYKLFAVMDAAASELSVPIIWGGTWKTFKDGPHYELDRKHYP